MLVLLIKSDPTEIASAGERLLHCGDPIQTGHFWSCDLIHLPAGPNGTSALSLRLNCTVASVTLVEQEVMRCNASPSSFWVFTAQVAIFPLSLYPLPYISVSFANESLPTPSGLILLGSGLPYQPRFRCR
jgi:hypothetical protein